MFAQFLEDLGSKLGQLLPNGNLAIPFELVTVYHAVNDIWDALPVAVRLSLSGAFALLTLFCIFRMLL